MKIENVTKVKVTSTKRIEKNLVESVPLREALINAVVHNDFSREIPPVFFHLPANTLYSYIVHQE